MLVLADLMATDTNGLLVYACLFRWSPAVLVLADLMATDSNGLLFYACLFRWSPAVLGAISNGTNTHR